MKTIVFIHQNMPGQFKFLSRWFGQRDGWRAYFLTRRRDRQVEGVQRITYDLHRQPKPETHLYMRQMEASVLHGQAVARKLDELRRHGITPDVIMGHTGWGETLYAKDVFPTSPLMAYSEFYYRARGADCDFDPTLPPSMDSVLQTRTRTAHMLLSMEAADHIWTATEWQRSVHPAAFKPLIEVCHEGIDTSLLKPDPNVRFVLPDQSVLTPEDEVITYVARNLEPYRGFPTFMRALPLILERRPNAKVLVVGGDDISYGKRPKDFKTWREAMDVEVDYDRSRVHFLGGLMYGDYRRVLQISSVHVYLTYPFVLSWSMLEAMSSGCLIVGSRTPPVEEVIEDGVNGLLVDFFAPEDVADRVCAVLQDPGAFAPLRRAARETVRQRYELQDCFARQKAMIAKVLN